MHLKKIEDLLTRTIGLDPQALGDRTIEHAVKRCMRQAKIEEDWKYERTLLNDLDELKNLIEEIVVNKTWFFREPRAFELATEFISNRIKMRGQRAVRVLSIGCATGEEPYSLAMKLDVAGQPLPSAQIHAVDISENALTQARRGFYTDRSFQGDGEDLIARYFTQADEGFILDKRICDSVRFFSGNVADELALPTQQKYDVVFCRHVMLYLCPETRKHVVSTIRSVLSPDGMLFVGTSEAPILRKSGFEPLSVPGSFKIGKKEEPQPDAIPKEVKRRRMVHDTIIAMQKGMAQKSFREKSTSLVVGVNGCWNCIGVNGNRSCEELAQYIHCRNCPVYADEGKQMFQRHAPPGYLEEWRDVLSKEKQTEKVDPLRCILFRIDTSWFACPLASTKEVAHCSAIHTIPHRSNRVLRGMVYLSGKIHLCASLHELLGLHDAGDEVEDQQRMLVLERDGETWAFLVDEVTTIHTFDLSESNLSQTTTQNVSRFTKKLMRWDGRRVQLLCDESLFLTLNRSMR